MNSFFDRNNIVHNSTLLLIGFAGVTDGRLSKRELTEIKKITIGLLKRFNLDIEINEEDFETLFNTVESHFKSFYFGDSKSFFEETGLSADSHSIEFIREISYAIAQIKLHPKFSNNLGDDLIRGLNTIAHSDGNFDKEEKRWIDIISKEFKGG
jgi:hypothetical protein